MLNQISRKIAQASFFLSLREAFIAMLPYMFLLAALGVIKEYAPAIGWLQPYPNLVAQLSLAHDLTLQLFSLAIVIAVSFYLCKNLQLNTIAGTVLAVTCFIFSISSNAYQSQGLQLTHNTLSAYNILIPTLTSYLLSYFSRISALNIIKRAELGRFLSRHINLILPFILVFLLVMLIIPLLSLLFASAGQWLAAQLMLMPLSEQMFYRILLSHLSWVVGIHGDLMVGMIDSRQLQDAAIIGNMPVSTFQNIFVYIGGSGGTLGLLLACLLQKGRSHEKSIAKIATPVTLFNINEILIYALPIVFNPVFILPFIVVPLVNYGIAYFAFSSGLLPMSDTLVQWVTPPVLDAWSQSNSLLTVLFQIALIVLNTLIYWPFVQLSIRANSSQVVTERLEKSISVHSKLELSLESSFVDSQGQTRESQKELNKILAALESGQLQLHYQPKVAQPNQTFSGFEALIRLKERSGQLRGPYFLDILRAHKLTHIIDLWVIKQVKKDLERWQILGFSPRVSINIDPVSLNSEIIDKLTTSFSQFPNQIEVEILESGYAENVEQVEQMVTRLNHVGIDVAMDDFGTGYANIAMLAQSNIHTIKLDRSLLQMSHTERGKQLYLQLVILCKRLGFQIVAEGVETDGHLELLNQTVIDELQGWYFSQALPFDKAHEYLLRSPPTPSS